MVGNSKEEFGAVVATQAGYNFDPALTNTANRMNGAGHERVVVFADPKNPIYRVVLGEARLIAELAATEGHLATHSLKREELTKAVTHLALDVMSHHPGDLFNFSPTQTDAANKYRTAGSHVAVFVVPNDQSASHVKIDAEALFTLSLQSARDAHRYNPAAIPRDEIAAANAHLCLTVMSSPKANFQYKEDASTLLNKGNDNRESLFCVFQDPESRVVLVVLTPDLLSDEALPGVSMDQRNKAISHITGLVQPRNQAPATMEEVSTLFHTRDGQPIIRRLSELAALQSPHVSALQGLTVHNPSADL